MHHSAANPGALDIGTTPLGLLFWTHDLHCENCKKAWKEISDLPWDNVGTLIKGNVKCDGLKLF